MQDFTRREFFAVSAAAAQIQSQGIPWYRRTLRWGQTNITERDPERYDIAFWREYWKRTQIQGVIINAGGIVAYYPSKFPLHRRAEFLNGRDLYGEIARAAHEDGLVVMARMDSNRAGEEFYKAHPDWFAVDASGKPYRAADKYITCINGPYYEEYLPGILVEIIERSKPEGLTDNSWAGLARESICYCANCRAKFGKPLPARADWDDPVYRSWIEWSYGRRTAMWELNNRVTRKRGGDHCIWSGMISGSFVNGSRTFRDYREICRRAEIIMLDHQRRSEPWGFQQNTDAGLTLHGVLGWDKLIPESMAMYQADRNSFRVSAKPAAEARMWMAAGFAGGIQPWWHHVGAFHEDRRAYNTAEPMMRWHRANEQYLVNRKPVAAVGVVWSQRNVDFYGRENPEDLVDAPYRGMVQALIRARIPYVPVHAEEIEAAEVSVLVLPDIAVLSPGECTAITGFVKRGGGLLATGLTSAYSERGEVLDDFALAELFGAHGSRETFAAMRRDALGSQHSYLRIGRPAPVFPGFDETEILPYGGGLENLRVVEGRRVPLTFIPAFPVYPPETAWMRQERTDIPGLILSANRAAGRPGARSHTSSMKRDIDGGSIESGDVAYLPADIDRRYAKDNLPDHANLLANIVRYLLRDRSPLRVEGAGLIDCTLYLQRSRLVLHVVNLSSGMRPPIDEMVPVGPFRVAVKAPPAIKSVQLLVSGAAVSGRMRDGWMEFEIPRVAEHEVALLS